MTESAFFASTAQRDSFSELGARQYKIVGTLDGYTCDVCGDMDSQVFDMKDFAPGSTAPPFHPWCRCATCPYYEDMEGLGERFARDVETGERYKVPGDMTYKQWKAKTIDKSRKSDIIISSRGDGNLAIPYADDKVPERVKKLIEKLPRYGSKVKVSEPISFEDIGLLSRQTGVEFASVSIGKKHYVIRGDSKGTRLPKALIDNKGRLNCHSHPFTGDGIPSLEDLELAKQMHWQDEFYIITPDGQQYRYNTMGVIDAQSVSHNLPKAEQDFYDKLFKEVQE